MTKLRFLFQCRSLCLGAVVAGLSIAANVFSQTVDLTLARQYFQQAEGICTQDNGRLWGISLCGPMLFVDPASRFAVASQMDREGQLTLNNSVYTGKLPAKVNVANTATLWAGVKWTMLVWPLPVDSHERGILLTHELWHRIQDEIGLPMSSPANAHLDSPEGRLWLQLEWRALKKALQGGSEHSRAAQDALTFRAYRRKLFANAAQEEPALELNEGLAEYTGVKLASASISDELKSAIHRIDHANDRPSFVRSFAYVSGPAYGILLDEAAGDWRKNLKQDVDLGNILARAIAFELPGDVKATALKASKSYGGDELRAAEQAREDRRQKALADYRTRLVEGPVLLIPLHKMQVQLDPNNLVPMEGLGTVYPTARVSDVWGILTASKGALMAPDWTKVTVSAPIRTDGQKIEGDGWRLELQDGWALKPGARKGDLVVNKLP
jgi:hypothetical protein